MNIEEIDIKDIEFGEPIEEREPNYREGYIRGIYRARNIIDSKQKEVERLNNIIKTLEEYVIGEQISEYGDTLEEAKKYLEKLKEKTMSEEVRPFEEYKEMIKDMPKEEMIRGLYDLSARVTKQENIIKEVREYIEENKKEYGSLEDNEKIILGILDKEKV